MTGTNYPHADSGHKFHPPISEQERHHAKLDYDLAMEGDDFDRLIWFGKWAGRLVDKSQ